MKINLVIIGLNYEYNLDICNMLADKTNLYLLDVNEYLNYTLMSRKNMLDVCGIEYLQAQENGIIKGCAEFENSVICMPSLYFLRDEQYKHFSKSIVVYIRFSKKLLKDIEKQKNQEYNTLPIDIITFEDIDRDLKNYSDFTVNVLNKKKETIVNEILSKLGGD